MLKAGIRMLRAEDLRPEMMQKMSEVSDILGISMAAAGVLLRHCNWSKDHLLERYMRDDSDKVLRAAGAFHRCTTGRNTTNLHNNNTCKICFDEDVTVPMIAMPCGHAFCKDCWHDFAVNAVDEGPVCVQLTCPQAGCTEKVTEDEIKLVVPPDVLAKYTEYQLRNFVESNPLTRWCPGKGCERVACALSEAAREADGNVAHCDACLTHFCLVCGEEPHAPALCKQLQLWNEKCRNESETANWILANTKSCPTCLSRIEKNQGCNHMTCQKCKYEFCWICMGDWKEHGANTGGYYKCNKYGDDTPATGNGGNSDAARAKKELDRYLHFYQRFHAHEQAEIFARKQLVETEQRMVKLQESENSKLWSDVEFLKTANEQLVECRRVLKYTYVFGFYLEASKMQRERFEHHQEMLERFTENLSELSEMPLEKMDRTDVVNQTRVVDRFMKNILKYVDDDMEENV